VRSKFLRNFTAIKQEDSKSIATFDESGNAMHRDDRFHKKIRKPDCFAADPAVAGSGAKCRRGFWITAAAKCREALAIDGAELRRAACHHTLASKRPPASSTTANVA
jgi:hypothetical protein